LTLPAQKCFQGFLNPQGPRSFEFRKTLQFL
jgi:hypothetical protein